MQIEAGPTPGVIESLAPSQQPHAKLRPLHEEVKGAFFLLSENLLETLLYGMIRSEPVRGSV
jgi:hypothetical protein